MELKKIWMIVVFVVCFQRSSRANNVNALGPVISRIKRSGSSNIYLALPPSADKIGKQNAQPPPPPTLIRFDPSTPIKFKGKFPTPIERFIQRIQNYFSVYNPPEYLNDLRPGINNPDNDDNNGNGTLVGGDINEAHIVLPCNGTSTIVIIPVPLETENVTTTDEQNSKPVSGINPPPGNGGYNADLTESAAANEQQKQQQAATTTTTTTTTTTATPTEPDRPCDRQSPTTKPICPHASTTTPKPKCQETATQKDITTTTTKSPPPPCADNNKNTGDVGPNQVPPINLIAQPVSYPTAPVVHNHKKQLCPPVPSYLPHHPPTPGYYVASTSPPCTGYPHHKSKQLPPIFQLKRMLFPRLFAALYPDDY